MGLTSDVSHSSMNLNDRGRMYLSPGCTDLLPRAQSLLLRTSKIGYMRRSCRPSARQALLTVERRCVPLHQKMARISSATMWQDLLPELLEEVAARCDVVSWMAMGGVCRHWRTHTRTDRACVRHGWSGLKDFKKTRHMVCALCLKRRGLVRYSSKIRECDRCREDPELRLVTKSTAMKLFLEQLEGVRCIRAPNPHGSSAPDMRLYRVKDLRAMKAVPEPC